MLLARVGSGYRQAFWQEFLPATERFSSKNESLPVTSKGDTKGFTGFFGGCTALTVKDKNGARRDFTEYLFYYKQNRPVKQQWVGIQKPEGWQGKDSLRPPVNLPAFLCQDASHVKPSVSG